MSAAEDKRKGHFVGGTLRARLGIVGLFVIVSAPILFFTFALRGKARTESNAAVLGDRTQIGGSGITAVVKRGDIQKTLVLSGELRAVKSRAIFASTDNETKITYLPPEGSFVKAGERVLELDNSTVLGKIKDLQEKLIAADNDIVKTQSTAESNLRDMGIKLSQLWLTYEQAKIDAAIPADVLDRRKYQENQLNLSKAKAEYESQQKKIDETKKEQAAELQSKTIDKQKLQIQLNQDKRDLAGMSVTAPADGMVIYANHWAERRKVQVGDVVWGGFPVEYLPDLSRMEVLARVNEVDGPKLSVGQKASVRLDSYPDTRLSGEVTEISQTAVKANFMGKSRVFNVVISLDKTEPDIMKPGMSAQVTVETASFPDKLLVPRSAVTFSPHGPEVVRIEGPDNKSRVVAVTIEASDAFHYAVADNGALKQGDQIIR